MVRIKKETANAWEHTNDNNATIVNFVDVKTSSGVKPNLM